MRRLLTCIGLVGMFVCLASCDKAKSPDQSPPPSSSNSPAPAASSAAASASASSISPQSSDVPAEPGKTGPGDGSTAIGGVVGAQESGGANTGKPPAATGGDAASAPGQHQK